MGDHDDDNDLKCACPFCSIRTTPGIGEPKGRPAWKIGSGLARAREPWTTAPLRPGRPPQPDPVVVGTRRLKDLAEQQATLDLRYELGELLDRSYKARSRELDEQVAAVRQRMAGIDPNAESSATADAAMAHYWPIIAQEARKHSGRRGYEYRDGLLWAASSVWTEHRKHHGAWLLGRIVRKQARQGVANGGDAWKMTLGKDVFGYKIKGLDEAADGNPDETIENDNVGRDDHGFAVRPYFIPEPRTTGKEVGPTPEDVCMASSSASDDVRIAWPDPPKMHRPTRRSADDPKPRPYQNRSACGRCGFVGAWCSCAGVGQPRPKDRGQRKSTGGGLWRDWKETDQAWEYVRGTWLLRRWSYPDPSDIPYRKKHPAILAGEDDAERARHLTAAQTKWPDGIPWFDGRTIITVNACDDYDRRHTVEQLGGRQGRRPPHVYWNAPAPWPYQYLDRYRDKSVEGDFVIFFFRALKGAGLQEEAAAVFHYCKLNDVPGMLGDVDRLAYRAVARQLEWGDDHKKVERRLRDAVRIVNPGLRPGGATVWADKILCPITRFLAFDAPQNRKLP